MENDKQKKASSIDAKKLLEKFTRRDLQVKGIDALVDLILVMEKDIKILSRTCDELDNSNAKLRKQLEEIKKRPADRYTGYDKARSWVWKLCFVLDRNKEPMTIKEIKTVLLTLEPDLEDRWLDPYHYLSQVAFQAAERGLISKEKSWRSAGYIYTLRKGPVI